MPSDFFYQLFCRFLTFLYICIFMVSVITKHKPK